MLNSEHLNNILNVWITNVVFNRNYATEEANWKNIVDLIVILIYYPC